MESTTIHTDGKPLLLRLKLYSPELCTVRIVGLDAHRKNSTYFNRTPKFRGFKEFVFPMPVSPGVLKVIASSDTGCPIDIRQPKIDRLNQCDIVDIHDKRIDIKKLDAGRYCFLKKDEIAFVKFAVEFAITAGILPAGMYDNENDFRKDDPDKKIFYINYLNGIIDGGKKQETPARISRAIGYIEINREKFIGYSIPMRIVILLHEFMHWRLNTRIELQADFNALNIFLKLGYSKTQALSAFTKVFHEKSHLQDRAQQIYDFIDKAKDLNPV